MKRDGYATNGIVPALRKSGNLPGLKADNNPRIARKLRGTVVENPIASNLLSDFTRCIQKV